MGTYPPSPPSDYSTSRAAVVQNGKQFELFELFIRRNGMPHKIQYIVLSWHSEFQNRQVTARDTFQMLKANPIRSPIRIVSGGYIRGSDSPLVPNLNAKRID